MSLSLPVLLRTRQELSATALGGLLGQLEGEDLILSPEDGASGPAAHHRAYSFSVGTVTIPTTTAVLLFPSLSQDASSFGSSKTGTKVVQLTNWLVSATHKLRFQHSLIESRVGSPGRKPV